MHKYTYEHISNLPDISYHTIDSAIKDLLKNGRIEKVGEFRNSRYRYRT